MFAIGDKEWNGLSKLLEEAGEVIQVGGKLMGSRGQVDHWSGNLRDKLVEELADLQAALHYFVDLNMTDEEGLSISNRANRKYDLYVQWNNEDPE